MAKFEIRRYTQVVDQMGGYGAAKYVRIGEKIEEEEGEDEENGIEANIGKRGVPRLGGKKKKKMTTKTKFIQQHVAGAPIQHPRQSLKLLRSSSPSCRKRQCI